MYHMLDLLQGSYPLDAKIDGIERKYLPQTYVSAVFLLTMLPSQEIIAIPEGIKRRFDLYGSKIHDITLTTDRRNFESIYLNNPCKAFTAFYTNPDIKRTLTLQGIPYVDIDKINTVEEIEEAIVDVGYHMDKPQTAFVIANFFKIAFKAIDLRIEAFYSDKELIPKRILLVEAFQSYTLPTKKSLSFQLLDRIKTSKVQVLKRSLLLQSRTWSEPINNENIFWLRWWSFFNTGSFS